MVVHAPNHGDDGVLVLAVQQGDGDAFAELFRRHYPAVRRACTRRLFNVHEADEVAQAAFVRAYERIDQCGGERSFGPWVHVIARSLCMDAFRAQARVEPREHPLAGGRDHRPNEPEESLLSQERVAQMQEALDSLPERQRRAVIARDWDGLRPGEIADRLGLSVGAVDSLLLRARRRLAHSYRRLAGEGGGGASTLPVRSAAAAAVVALALGPQAVLAGTAAAAHAVQDTAGRAAGGVAAAVVAVALSLSGGAFEPAPAPPPAAVVVTAVTVPRTPTTVGPVPMPDGPSVAPAGGPDHAPTVPAVAPSAEATSSATATTSGSTTARTTTQVAGSASTAATPPTTSSTVPTAPPPASAPPSAIVPAIPTIPSLADVVPVAPLAPEEAPAPSITPAPAPTVAGLLPVPEVPAIPLPALALGERADRTTS